MHLFPSYILELKKKTYLAILLEVKFYLAMLSNLTSDVPVMQEPSKMLDSGLCTGSDTQDYHKKYLGLKRKFKVLLYVSHEIVTLYIEN